METSRRGFLRILGVGAAAAVAAPIIKPKSFFSFFTGLWRPEPAGPVLGNSVLTLADIARRMPANFQVAKIADLLNEPCTVFDDLPWLTGPIPVGHRTTIRQSLIT